MQYIYIYVMHAFRTCTHCAECIKYKLRYKYYHKSKQSSVTSKAKLRFSKYFDCKWFKCMLVHDHKYNLNLHYLTLQWRIGMFTASSSFCICSYVVENYQLMTVLYIKKYLWQNICVFDNVLNSVLNINILLCTIVSGTREWTAIGSNI